MINRLRSLSASLITHHHLGPRILQIRTWAWLTAETDDLEEKMRCLKAIVALDPDLEWARAALEDMRYRQAQMN